MASERHYLQLPARRLLSGGDRPNQEDSLVDYVTGLEALLTSDDQAELNYRMSVRGAIVLSKETSHRPDHLAKMREMYLMRSQVVHGANLAAGRRPAIGRLPQVADYAEYALRRCWHWYFENWAGEEDSGPAIVSID